LMMKVDLLEGGCLSISRPDALELAVGCCTMAVLLLC
jgi:hypothetical protein